jgi:hypothetical protein
MVFARTGSRVALAFAQINIEISAKEKSATPPKAKGEYGPFVTLPAR